MPPSDLQLLELQVDALFTHDLNGRIRWINEPGERPAPRFFFGRTKEGNLWRFRHDLPQEVVRHLEPLAATEPITGDLRAEPLHLASYRVVLQEHAVIVANVGGPAYYFPEQIQVAGNPVMITEANVEMLRALIPEQEMQNIVHELPVRQPWVVVVQEGMGVASCFCARKTERVAEAGVWTLDPFRGQGYALACVATWAQLVRATGRIPLYSTSWENVASQAVARKLGLIPYAADLSLM